MKKILLILTIAAAAFSFACGSGSSAVATGKAIKSGPVANLTVTVSSSDGVLHKGKQDLFVTFADAAGKPVDVGAASVNFFMPAMGSMSAMNEPATLTTTSTPGIYSAQANIEMTGEWQVQIKYEGPAGKGNATLPITAQ